MVAGLLSGLSGIVHTARAISGQAGVGVGFELDAIAAAVIGGTSLSGGVGRMTGTVIGAVILGILTSGFTFLNVDAHYQEIIKGGVIVAAVVADQYRQRRAQGSVKVASKLLAVRFAHQVPWVRARRLHAKLTALSRLSS